MRPQRENKAFISCYPGMILLGTALLEGTFGYDNLSLSLLYCSNVSILLLRKYLEGQISEFIRQCVGKVFYVILQLPFQILHSQVALMKTVYLFNVLIM